MYNKKYVIPGILIFIALFTSPFWLNVSAGEDSVRKPDIKYPAAEKQCIESKEYMRAYHMEMLNSWRDNVVRNNIRFVSFKGHPTEMSLTSTCMKCHESKAEFCDRCHNFVDVNPYCWNCHNEPKGVKSPHE
jgi:hypothetical protein